MNPKYGRQFSTNNWVEKIPATVFGIEKYLGSGLIKGIGPKYAKMIVNHFKEDTIEVIEKNPERLLEVDNIGKKRVQLIKTAWNEHKDIKDIMIFLQSYNVSTAFGHRIYKVYRENSIDIIKENPYRLVDDVYGIGFKTADNIAEKMGIDKDSYFRCRAGLFHVLSKAADEGHCYLLWDTLIEKSIEILGVTEQVATMTASHLIIEKELIRQEENKIYMPPFFYAETGAANRIRAISKYKNISSNRVKDDEIKTLENELGLSYDNIQVSAIKLAVSSKFLVLTGGPGTGKTTITKAIITLMRNRSLSVLLAAPTGRAAKKMSESCGIEAKTIHRLLGSKPPNGYEKNAENPLKGDVLIVDESSMIDILLLNNLLKAVPDEMAVILIGDIDQLPSVGAGNILNDIINSEIVPVIKLTHIYRQAANSRIITNAHKVNNGIMPDLTTNTESDFFFIECTNEEIPGQIIELCSKRLPRYYKVNPIQDIQVLSPMRRGETGIDNLNILLQNELNPNNQCLRRGATEYRVGDKVIQLRNNYDKNIFNGAVGFVQSIDSIDKTLDVNYDGAVIKYDILELDELMLAYATTIHKAQGGEFPIVVMPFTFSHYTMLTRNLLYTGITRAKEVLIIIGEVKAISYAVKNIDAIKRNTSLDLFIKSH